MPRVSVVMPSYNCAQYLAEAVDSALAQTYRDFEIVVVDDGSKDNTEEVARRYGSKIQYIKQENRGLPGARNTGIRASSGEYIALLDADDSWFPEKLARQIPEFADPEVGLVYSDLRVVYDNGEVVPSFLSGRPLAASGHVFDRVLQSGFIIPSSVILRRSCVEQVGLFDESMRSQEDVEMWLRVCLRWKVKLVAEPLVNRRQRAGALTENDDLRTAYHIKLFHKALEIPGLSAENRARILRRLANSYYERGYYCLDAGKIAECRKSLRRSLKYDWRNLGALRSLLLTFIPGPVRARMRRSKARAWPR